jgi:hypothetical protein
MIIKARFAKLRQATVRVCMSVGPSTWNNSGLVGRIFMKLIFEDILEKFVDKN